MGYTEAPISTGLHSATMMKGTWKCNAHVLTMALDVRDNERVMWEMPQEELQVIWNRIKSMLPNDIRFGGKTWRLVDPQGFNERIRFYRCKYSNSRVIKLLTRLYYRRCSSIIPTSLWWRIPSLSWRDEPLNFYYLLKWRYATTISEISNHLSHACPGFKFGHTTFFPKGYMDMDEQVKIDPVGLWNENDVVHKTNCRT